jgi:alkylated DNA repair dioxygenase AlkB
MNILEPRKDFLILENFFERESARYWLKLILKKGEDPLKGFHHPHVRPNRFHKAPKYPVKKFMCLGLYWNPVDYLYYPIIPDTGEKTFKIPNSLHELALEVLKNHFPWKDYSPESILVNFYTKDSSMGLHVDKDEENHEAPVIGLNFGSTCRFFYEDESGVMRDLRIPGNSVYIFGKSARLMRHGLGSIYAKTLSDGSEDYLQDKERLNLTIRQVFKV